MKDINWDTIECASLTVIRRDWPVEKLIRMEAEGHYTPVSGDDLKSLR